jgi:molecular chaperone HscB
MQEPRIVCIECQAPLASNLDCFAALELPRKLEISPDKLEAAYHRIGRMVHPDRFATRPVKVRQASQRVAALLTRAYRTLRDPVGRGSYWLELNGYKLAENNQQVPADLAALVFETQEELAELRVQPAAPEVMGKLQDRRSEILGKLDQLASNLNDLFASFDRNDGTDAAPLFDELKRILSETSYLRTLLRDLEKALDSRAAA